MNSDTSQEQVATTSVINPLSFASVALVEQLDRLFDAVLAADERGEIVDCNRAATQLFNCSKPDLLGTPIIKWLPAIEMVNGAQPCESTYTAISIHDRQSVASEIQVARTQDGTHRPVIVDAGAPAYGHASVRMIIVRDQSEIQSLRQELKRRDALMNFTTNPALIQVANGTIETVNPAFESVFGYRADEVIGKAPSDLLYGDQTDRQSLQSALDAVMCGGHVQHDEVLYTKNGMPKWIACEQHAILDDMGAVTHVVTSGADVTERHCAEQRKTDFVSMVGHELRTPLTAVTGSLELMEDGRFGELPEAVGQLVDLAHRNCTHLNVLIGDLLDVNKMEAGLIALNNEQIDVNDVAQQAAASLQHDADEKNIRITCVEPNQPPYVYSDAARLNQILLNLISNAIKYTDDGGSITVRSDVQADMVRVSVTDNGRGIAEDFQPQIFNKFAREPAAQASGIPGFGLGLSICKGLIEHMGGRINFISKLGEGSTFYVELPVATASNRSESTGEPLTMNL